MNKAAHSGDHKLLAASDKILNLSETASTASTNTTIDTNKDNA